jgi:Uma2 family endonuclease
MSSNSSPSCSTGQRRAAGLFPMLSIFNLGEPGDYRVPDGGLHGERSDRLHYPTAALVVDVVSPEDETWEKLGFYAAHRVDELLIVDPQERRVEWMALSGREYKAIGSSQLTECGAAALSARLEWPE